MRIRKTIGYSDVWGSEIKGEKEARERQAEGDSGDGQPTYTGGRPHPGAPTAYGFGRRGWPDTLPGPAELARCQTRITAVTSKAETPSNSPSASPL